MRLSGGGAFGRAIATAIAVLLAVTGSAAAAHPGAAAEPGAIVAAGIVTDADTANPIAGALVTLYWYDGDLEEYQWVDDDLTGVDGSYTVIDATGNGAGWYLLDASSPAYASDDQARDWRGAAPLVVNFGLLPAVQIATGVVADAVSSSPIGGALVQAYYDNGSATLPWAGEAYTDADGRYTVYDQSGFDAGDYYLQVRARGYDQQGRRFSWDGLTLETQDFALFPGTPLAVGTVRNAQTFAPIPDASVAVLWYDSTVQQWLIEDQTISGASGQYALYGTDGHGTGTYRFYAEADGYLSQMLEGVWDGSSSLLVDFELESDAYEPDDTFGQAHPITVDGARQQHILYPAGDQDWVTFDAVGGFRYVIQTMPLGTYETDTCLSLFAADGQTPLGYNDDWEGEPPFSLISWLAPTNQTVYVMVRHWNDIGGTGPYELRVVAYDEAPPTTTLAATPPVPDGLNGWYASAPSITLATNEPAATYYWWGSDDEAEYTGALTADEGSNTLHFYSVDLVPNPESPQQRTFKVDTVPPSAPGAVSVTPLSTTALRVSWSAATDATSGIWQYSVRDATTDAVLGTTTGTTFDLAGLAPGTSRIVYVLALDNAGRYGSESADATGETPLPLSGALSINGGVAYNTSRTITLTSDVPDAAEMRWRSSSNGGATWGSWTGWSVYDASTDVTVGADGAWTFEAEYRDGVRTLVLSDGIYVDTVKPSITVSGAANGASYSNPVKPVFSATDGGSGLSAPAAATLDGTTFTSGAEVAAPGAHTLEVSAADRAGNAQVKTVSFSIVAAPAGLAVAGIAGANRIATAIEVSSRAFPAGADWVVIATAYNWPDALGGSALAGALGGPILLTRSDALPAEVLAEITRLGASKAIILGSQSAVSAGVESALKAKMGAGAVTRIGGANRYETARLIAARTVTELGGAYEKRAFVTTGANFPDALGASPLAAARGWPIYLVSPRGLDAATVASMAAAGVTKAIVLGDAKAVSESAKNEIATRVPCDTKRLAGANRYDTAVQVAAFGVSEAGLYWNQLAIATGENFPDALAGGILQGKSSSVMLLTPSTSLNGSVRAALGANKAVVHEVRFLGDTKAVSAGVRAAVTDALQ